jgi:hypothetical protein
MSTMTVMMPPDRDRHRPRRRRPRPALAVDVPGDLREHRPQQRPVQVGEPVAAEPEVKAYFDAAATAADAVACWIG